jgi:hypothetical protein
MPLLVPGDWGTAVSLREIRGPYVNMYTGFFVLIELAFLRKEGSGDFTVARQPHIK